MFVHSFNEVSFCELLFQGSLQCGDEACGCEEWCWRYAASIVVKDDEGQQETFTLFEV